MQKFEAEKYRKYALVGTVVSRLVRIGLESADTWGLVSADQFYKDNFVKQNLSYIVAVFEVRFSRISD